MVVLFLYFTCHDFVVVYIKHYKRNSIVDCLIVQTEQVGTGCKHNHEDHIVNFIDKDIIMHVKKTFIYGNDSVNYYSFIYVVISFRLTEIIGIVVKSICN